NAAAAQRATPPAPVAAAPTGEALVAYDLLETLSGTAVSRVHYRKLALLPRGATCKGAGGGADGICAARVRCDTPRDGVGQACGKTGWVGPPAADARCGPDGGAGSCATFSTVCRTYQDQPLGVCVRFGECATSSSLELCAQYTNARDQTPCAEGPCSDG